MEHHIGWHQKSLESGHNELADIWSVGVTAIEMFDGKPPHSEFHAMRAIFLIPNKPPPTIEEPSEASDEFNDFIAKCCVKDFRQRPSAKQMLECAFMKIEGNRKRILDLIEKEQELIEQAGGRKALLEDSGEDDEDDDDDSSESDSSSDSSDYESE